MRIRNARALLTRIGEQVAGTNYKVKVKVSDGDYIHVVVFKPLPYTQEPPKVSKVEVGKAEGDAL